MKIFAKMAKFCQNLVTLVGSDRNTVNDAVEDDPKETKFKTDFVKRKKQFYFSSFSFFQAAIDGLLSLILYI